MNIFKSIIGITAISILLVSCVSMHINEAASTNKALAKAAITQIKESGIVVIFPTEHKKEKALVGFAKSNPSLQEDIDTLRSRRNERLSLWQNTKKEYSFNKMSIVPDSLLKSYIADPNHAIEIGENGELLQADLGDIYVLYTEYGGFEIKQNGKFIPNPFPNNVQAAWGSSIRDFLGLQSEEKNVTRFFTELDSQLNIFYGLTQREGN